MMINKMILYKGWIIESAAHPKLSGKYEYCNPDGDFEGRAYTIKEAKMAIKIEVLYQQTITRYVSKWKNKYFDDDSKWYIIEITHRLKKDDIKKKIAELLTTGHKVEAGYMATALRGCRDRYIFYLKK